MQSETERKRMELAGIASPTERAFQAWGHFVIRHRVWAILLPILATAGLASLVGDLTIDNSTEGFLHPDAPESVRYREFRDRFDRDDRIIVAIAPENVFDLAFLEKLRRFHLALGDELPYTQEITSLFNARSTRGEGDRLIVEDLLEGWLDEWPAEPSIDGLRERVLANPLYRDALVSEDASLTTVVIKPFTYSTSADASATENALAGFEDEPGIGAAGDGDGPPLLTAAENDELLAALHAVIERFDAPDFPLHVGGALAVTDHINRTIKDDMGRFFGLAILVIATLLAVLFRRLLGAVLPMMVVVLSVVASIGVMILLDIPATMTVQILPVFLLSVGICDAVHIMAITYQRIEAGHSRRNAIAYAIGHSGLAVVMTSLTTAAGMVSFISAEMAPVSQLGIIAPIGVLIALAYTLVLLPALLSLVPLERHQARAAFDTNGFLIRHLVRIGDFASDHPKRILAGVGVVTLLSLAGASQVRFSHYALSWFDPDDPVRVSAEIVDHDLRGSMSLEVVVDTGEENGLHDPKTLARIERAMIHASQVRYGDLYVGKAVSIVDVLKETHQALNGNDPAFRRLPDDRALIAQELLLFENAGAEDLEELVDSRFQTARISLKAPFVDAMHYGPFIENVRGEVEAILGDGVDVEMTGFMPVLASVVSAVVTSMARSYVVALLIITPMMVLLLRSLRLGLISMIPNVLPILVTLGLMGALGYPLDGSTIIIGAMVIGIAVDDTIHFMHKFRMYYERLGDPKAAIRETLTSTGTAMLVTSLVLAGGFFVLGTASMVNTRSMGLLAGVATLIAFVADILVAPALMTLAVNRENRDRAAPVSSRATTPLASSPTS